MKSWFICSILSLVLLVGAYLPVAADLPPGDTCAWIGAADDNWHNPANWGCGHVPGPNDLAIVAPPVVRWPRISPQPAAFAGSVTINGGATLALDPNAALTVSAGLTLDQASELFPGANSTITLHSGDWIDNGAIVDQSQIWNLTLDGQGNQAITGQQSTQSFGNLHVRNMSMGLPLFNCGPYVEQLNLKGTLTLGADTTFNTGAAVVTVEGDWLNNGATYQGSGGVTFAGGNEQQIGGSAPSQTFPGQVQVNKTAGSTLRLGGSTTVLIVNGPLSVNGGAFSLESGTLNTLGPTMIDNGGRMNLGAVVWNSGACLYIRGTFAPGTGTFNFRGSDFAVLGGSIEPGAWTANFLMRSPQTINGMGTVYFHNLHVRNDTMGGPNTVLRVGDDRGGGPSEFLISGDLTIGEGVTFNPGSVRYLYLRGANWRNDGLYVSGTGTVTFMGSNGSPQALHLTAAQTITGASETAFHNLTIANPAGVTLGSSQRVSGTLNLRDGDLTTGASTLFLEPAATVAGTHEVVGTVQRTQPFIPGTPYSFTHVNTRIVFSSPSPIAAKGTIAVTLQKAAPAGLAPAVARTYTIAAPAGNYTGTLRLAYQDTELNGIPEADLRLWRRDGAAWSLQGRSAADPEANWIERDGVTQFSSWTLAPETASPPERRLYLPLVMRY